MHGQTSKRTPHKHTQAPRHTHLTVFFLLKAAVCADAREVHGHGNMTHAYSHMNTQASKHARKRISNRVGGLALVLNTRTKKARVRTTTQQAPLKSTRNTSTRIPSQTIVLPAGNERKRVEVLGGLARVSNITSERYGGGQPRHVFQQPKSKRLLCDGVSEV